MQDREIKNIIKSIFEARYLKRIPRSGSSLLLGSEVSENVAEHSFYVSLWGIVMHHLNPDLDLGKLLTMCLTHDLEEVRTGDLNLINKFYLNNKVVSKSAFEDMWNESDLGERLIEVHNERLSDKSLESKAAADCDTLAQLVTEKEYFEKGNKEAEEWMEFTTQRLLTDEGKKIANTIIGSRLGEWWEEIKNKIREKNNLPKKQYN